MEKDILKVQMDSYDWMIKQNEDRIANLLQQIEVFKKLNQKHLADKALLKEKWEKL